MTPSNFTASGAAAVLAFESRIMHGNHNNAMLIDRALLAMDERLMVLQNRVAFDAARALAPIYGLWPEKDYPPVDGIYPDLPDDLMRELLAP